MIKYLLKVNNKSINKLETDYLIIDNILVLNQEYLKTASPDDLERNTWKLKSWKTSRF